MGFYICPKKCLKEEWLSDFDLLDDAPKVLPLDPKFTIVCLVDNKYFTAAGICYNQDELERFQSPTDHRPKRWFLVSKDAIVEEFPTYKDIPWE